MTTSRSVRPCVPKIPFTWRYKSVGTAHPMWVCPCACAPGCSVGASAICHPLSLCEPFLHSIIILASGILKNLRKAPVAPPVGSSSILRTSPLPSLHAVPWSIVPAEARAFALGRGNPPAARDPPLGRPVVHSPTCPPADPAPTPASAHKPRKPQTPGLGAPSHLEPDHERRVAQRQRRGPVWHGPSLLSTRAVWGCPRDAPVSP